METERHVERIQRAVMIIIFMMMMMMMMMIIVIIFIMIYIMVKCLCVCQKSNFFQYILIMIGPFILAFLDIVATKQADLIYFLYTLLLTILLPIPNFIVLEATIYDAIMNNF